MKKMFSLPYRYSAMVITTQTMLVMKLTAVLLIAACLQVSANGNAQKISISQRNTTLEKVFKEIHRKTGYQFFYQDELLRKANKFDINVKNASIEEVLDVCFKNQPLNFTIQEKAITIKRKEQVIASNAPPPLSSIEIRGQVKDENGKPLSGVSVTIVGQKGGIITDNQGNFLITVPENAVLSFSYVDHKTVTVSITGKTFIEVTLNHNPSSLNDVVIVGYGTSSKKKMVGAVSSINGKELEQLPFSNVSQALQGRVPGLILENNGGAPGSVPTLSIRGGGKPLYVIDGVVIDEGDDFSFSSLNVNDIESMSFLKDASSTAVFGSRAGNGIILVKTKRGREGAMRLNYSFNYQLSSPTVLAERLNSYEFAQIQNQAIKNDGGTTPAYTQAQLDKYKNHTDLVNYPDNNWYDLTLKKYAPELRHNISLSGGDKKTKYFISLGYFDQKGLYKSNVTDLTRINIRSNVTTNFDKIGLEVGVNVNASLQNRKEPGNSDGAIWHNVLHLSPNVQAYNPDGTYAAVLGMPLAYSDERAGYIKQREKFINTQIVANWKVPGITGLKVGIMGNYRDDDNSYKNWLLTAPQYNPDGTIYPVPKPSLNSAAGYNTKLDFETNISYSNTFGKHGIDAVFAHIMTKGKGEYVSATRRDYISGAVDQVFAGPSAGRDNSGTGFSNANEGYVGRMKYDFLSKYILEFSFRYDGNDNFAPAKRWGLFPSISGAWIVSDEKFMKKLKEKNILNFLKLRASSGKTGIAEGVIRHGYLAVYNLESNAYTIGNSLVTGFTEGPLVNANALTWYTRNSQNFGVDFALLKNRLEGSFDYFYYKTSGYLMSPRNQYTTTLGRDLPQISSNSVQLRAGYELALNYRGNIGSDFKYEIGLNYTRFNQLWKQLDSEDSVTLKNPYTRTTHQTDYWVTPGGFNTPEYSTFYISNGLYQGANDILNSPRRLASTDTKSGDIKYMDVNGDGKIDENDLRRIGLPSFPHANYGIRINFSYKGWYLNSLFQGTGNRYVYFGNEYQRTEGKDLTMKFQQDSWSPDNPNALLPRITNTARRNGENNSQPSDFWLKNSKYFRLKSLQIGYDLKTAFLKKQPFISACKIILSGTNLYTISNVMKYFDPENNVGNGSIYPIQKTYSLGLNVEF